MNWPIFITITVIGLSVGILLTFKNKSISRNAETALLQSIQTNEELEVSTTDNSLLKQIFNNSESTKNAGSIERTYQEYIHPELLEAKNKRQKVLGLAVGAVIGIFLFILLSGQAKIVGLFVPLVGYIVPMFISNSKRKKMRQDVIESIPDLLGYMAIFIGGMSLYKTLDLILKHGDPKNETILHVSLRQSIKENQFGMDLFTSLENQAALLGVQEWISCVFTLNEGVRLGKELQTVVLEIEEDFRNERKLKLEMEASKVTTKLSLISSLLFMPSIYTYTMIPAYLQLFKVM